MERKKCKLMPKIMAIILLITALASNITYSQAATDDKGSLKTYIVFVEKPGDAASSQSEDLDSWYKSFLPVKTASLSLKKGLVFSYRNVFIGFAAKLTPEEVSAMAGKEGFVSAHPERILSVQTTETPSFLGLHQNTGFWNQSSYGKGMIIGLMDTGILHDHPSFSDEQMSPPPAKWKGTCDFNVTVCNNKLIGAKNLLSPGEVPTDDYMHGTHTAGTAAGSPVPGANFFGQANGTAIGMAPLAHLAMYKVCNVNGRCPESAVLAAMDSAIEDGVDVMSLSLGYGTLPFFNDTIALGAYRAIQKGIFVSCSAGNSGPDNSSLSNEAPWILTVGASTVDRAIRATVLLGNNKELVGQSLLQPNFTSALFPLVDAGANGNASSAACAPGSLKNTDVKGKIVLCERGMVAGTQKAQEVNNSGGVAMILMNSAFYGYVTFPVSYMIPSTLVSYAAGEAIRAYINSTSSPMATILFKGTVTGLPEAPQVAEFSSRGPSVASPGILKPDVIGPGVEVLAAWPESYDNSSNSLTKFAMISGTSMSCPHLAGIAALLKSTHPDWSPAAIKSAIITTADLLNLGGKPITDDQFVPVDVFTIGGGHVNPSRANDPGLVYDLQPDDFIPYLCGLQYTDREVGLIAQKTVSCSNVSRIPEAQLNYPSFSIRLGASPQTYTRTVTNVGDPISAYALEIEAPEGVDVKVTPASINFSGLNQKATYTVTFSKNGTSSGSFAQGYLNWKDGKHIVRSPIAVLFV